MTSQHHYALADQTEASSPRVEDEFQEVPKLSSDLGSIKDESLPTSYWTIGWITPGAIVTCYLFAVTIACAHLGFFIWLNGREIDKSIQQSYVSGLSVFFVNAFRMFLAAALGISFIQMLWKELRARPMRLYDLDSLLSILSNPLYLGRISLVAAAPFPFLCALFCWCIPIAMVFPPGALTVASKALHVAANQTVPTFDPSYMGNGTFLGMMENALWQPDDFNAYSGPSNQLNRLATQSIVGGRYLISPSPCGPNCSYAIDITGPSFRCTDYVYPGLQTWVDKSYLHIPPMPYLFMASSDNPARKDPSRYSLEFHMQWKQAREDIYQNLSCVAYESTYALDITYTNGEQSIKTKVHQIQALNSAGLYDDFAVAPESGRLNSTINATITSLPFKIRHNLTGRKVLHQQQTANTIISLSNLYAGPERKPTFGITPASMQDLLQNITLSLLTLNQTTTLTRVEEARLINFYAFRRPARLIAPYLVTLAVALAFAIGGGHALVSNGISASTTGLFQTLCTTRGSQRLEELAAKGSLGGMENVPEELKNLKVRFGELKSSRGVRIASLGPEEEVVPLVKGSI
ncbi:hypothetical protein BBP40_011255 [Aspergillus hancockii]|nr:hypothetical protein BBP40_011255 [Aspergillus hancockii]